MKNDNYCIKIAFLFILAFIINVSVCYAETLTKGESLYEYNGNHMYRKSIGGKPAFCISGISVDVGENGSNCTIQRTGDAGLAYIIKNGYVNDSDYIKVETAVMMYSEVYDFDSSRGEGAEVLVGYAHNPIRNKYNDIENSTFEINFQDRNLSFTNEDDKYVSQEISLDLDYVSGEPEINVSGVEGAEIVGDYTSFHIEIPVSSITQTTTVTLNVSATQEEYYTASIYKCGGGQELVVLGDKVQNTDSKRIQGTIRPGLTIKKVDENGKLLEGASIKLCRDKDCTDVVYSWTDSEYELTDINDGTYYLVEKEAPSGYNSIEEPITIKISKGLFDGSKTEYKLINTMTKVTISKKSATTKKELPGATLQILDGDKGNISCTMIKADGSEEELKECKWVSTDKPIEIVGLSQGKYFLKEVEAPDGYVLSDSMVEFEIKSDSKTNSYEMVNEAKVPDTLSTRSAIITCIAMLDIALGIGIINYVKKNKTSK